MLIKENDNIQHYYLRTLDNYVTNFEDKGEIEFDDMIRFCQIYMKLSPRRQKRYKVMLDIVNDLWIVEEPECM